MSKELIEFFRHKNTKFSGVLQILMSEKLNVFLPPNELEPEPGAASKELPAIIRIGSDLEFYFTKETTKHLMQSKFSTAAKYQQLHSLAQEDIFGYLECSLSPETKLIATGMMEVGTITIFIQKTIKGSLFEVTIQFSRNLFKIIMMLKRIAKS